MDRVKWSGAFLAVFGVTALGTAVRADMMPMTPSSHGWRQTPRSCFPIGPQGATRSDAFAGHVVLVPGGLFHMPSPILEDSEGQIRNARSARILTDRQNSLGLGACRSVPLVKKLFLSQIPQWYHDGGPFQIGHSHAISPDCSSHAPACCFTQPSHTGTDRIARYPFAAGISFWYKPQFTPAARASRGPPFCARQRRF
ncbi:MAG: hypothetical protein ABFE13_16895 [Phycisphaerales bacterium]